jgi:transglutaminase-like putative cysteine protease
MLFNLFSELSYDVYSTTTFIFNIKAAISPNQKIIEESVVLDPFIPFEEFVLNNARFIKLQANAGQPFTITYKAKVEVKHEIIDEKILLQSVPFMDLNDDIWPFLFPSRHCQSDKLEKFASKEFGNLSNNYLKVLAINSWIFNNIDYISGTTDSGTSAYDTLIQRQGVCKDFAHLGIALCRALHIPARYFTSYAYQLYPPDFHACFEAYVGGKWIIFDSTGLVPINGLVKIANGSDAAEVAVANFFGNTFCTYMNIQCNLADETFTPFIAATDKLEALAY